MVDLSNLTVVLLSVLICLLIGTVIMAVQKHLQAQSVLRQHRELEQQMKDQKQAFEELQGGYYSSKEELAKAQAALEFEQQRSAERLHAYEQAEARLTESFKNLSSDILQNNSEGFMRLAEMTFAKYEAKAQERLTHKEDAIRNLVNPIRETLDRFDHKVHELEKKRVGAYEGVYQRIDMLLQAHQSLEREASKLSTALRSPTARGRWGELHLRRVVELAGMTRHCDFIEQSSVDQRAGAATLRPDMIVQLPGERRIIVDAKTPLDAYMDAAEATNEERRMEALRKHAQMLRKHVTQLSSKGYWSQFPSTPECVLLYIPGEAFLAAAMQVDPKLVEDAIEKQVVIASPSSLILMLRTAAFSWKQYDAAENVKEVSQLGRELYGRIADFSSHMNDMGKHVRNVVGSYNKAIGTLESRLLVSARRFKDLQVDDARKDIAALEPLQEQPREMRPLNPAQTEMPRS